MDSSHPGGAVVDGADCVPVSRFRCYVPVRRVSVDRPPWLDVIDSCTAVQLYGTGTTTSSKYYVLGLVVIHVQLYRHLLTYSTALDLHIAHVLQY